MSQKQYPSINEATHVLEGRYYKIGEYTSYMWVGDHWEFAACTPELVRKHGTPLKTQQEAQERTLDQPATTLPTPSSNSPSLPVQEVSGGIQDTSWKGRVQEALKKPGSFISYNTTEERKKILDEMVKDAEDMGLYDMVGNPLVKPLIPSMTEKNANATCDPTSPDNRQVGGDHYKRMKVQPWTADEAWMTKDQFVGHLLGSAIDYLARFNSTSPGKGGLQDVEKAKHCLEKLIDTLKKEKKGG